MFEISDEINEIIKGVVNAENKRQIEIKNLKTELGELKKAGVTTDPKRFAEILYLLSVFDPAGYDEL